MQCLFSRKLKYTKTVLFFVGPALLVITLIMVYPLIKSIDISFTNRIFSYEKYSFTGLRNYGDMLKDRLFWQSLYNSCKLTMLSVTGSLLVGLTLALLLNNTNRYQKVFRGMLFIPWVMPTMATSLIFRWMYNDFYGYLNYILTRYHIIAHPVNLLADMKLAWLGIIIPIVWSNYAFVMLVFLAALQSIDRNLYEAAQIDGANRWQTFLAVTLPGLKPAFVMVAILQIIWDFASFDLVYLLTKGGPGNSTLTLSLYIYKKAFDAKLLGYACALGTVMFVVLFVFTLLYFVVIRRTKIYEN